MAERGQLKNGNPSGDPSKAPRCGAKTRNGAACNAPAMCSAKTGKYTRCRMHGGASTGPQTEAGLERCRQARWIHGKRSASAVAERTRRAAAHQMACARLRKLERLLRSPLRSELLGQMGVLDLAFPNELPHELAPSQRKDNNRPRGRAE